MKRLARTSLVVAALVVGGCATERAARPVALDPANPGAPEGTTPALIALAETPAPTSPAETHEAAPAASEHQHHAEAPDAEPSAAREAPAPPAIKKAPGPAKSKSGNKKAPAIYTCPMHPEIHSPKPGRCPKCGMKLVPEASGENGHQH